VVGVGISVLWEDCKRRSFNDRELNFSWDIATSRSNGVCNSVPEETSGRDGGESNLYFRGMKGDQWAKHGSIAAYFRMSVDWH